VNSRFLLFVLCLNLNTQMSANATPCEGKGSVVFFGNGMFNTEEEARRNQRLLEAALKANGFSDSTKPIVTDLAYKRSEPVLEQLANVAKQKGVTEFENFWAWLASLQRAPTWFIDDIKIKSAELSQSGSMNFTGLKAHFEAYSKYIRK